MIYFGYTIPRHVVIVCVVSNRVPARTIGKIRGALVFETKQNIWVQKGCYGLKRRKIIMGTYGKLADEIERRFASARGKVIRLDRKPTARTYENTNTSFPWPIDASEHIKLLHDRKPFKYAIWALRNRRENG